MMNWCCFKFWLCWRLVMASLAHFNWFTAIYVNCIYFTLWKSYDLLWFWMHFFLCFCFEPLRSENYLLVVTNLFVKKRKKYPNKTYRQIYNLLYNQRFTKSEKRLKRIETIERGKLDQIDDSSTDSDDENDEKFGDDDEQDKSLNKKSIYPNLDYEEPAMPKINVDRQKQLKENLKTRMEKEALINNETIAEAPTTSKNPTKNVVEDAAAAAAGGGGTSVVSSGDSSNKSRLLKILPKKILPNFVLQRSESKNSINAEQEAEKKRLIEEQKKRAKEEKCQQKELRKRLNARQKEELRKQATIERRRRNLSMAIDLLLTYLRLMTTFAMLVGNIHKTFMPKYLEAPGEDIIDNPDLLMIFTITMSLDILLFWTSMFWTFFRQCRLCCRLGILKFLLWLIMLGILGGLGMYMPMHHIYKQLDQTWCVFLVGTPLSEYFDG